MHINIIKQTHHNVCITVFYHKLLYLKKCINRMYKQTVDIFYYRNITLYYVCPNDSGNS